MREVMIAEANILRHVFRREAAVPSHSRFGIVEARHGAGLSFENRFYHANVGTPDKPVLLELRFEETDHGFWIALLMTNERYPRDLEILAQQIDQRVRERGIDYDAVLAPESLGPPLGNALARLNGQRFPATSLQKGKPRIGEDGVFGIGPPKAWIGMDDGIPASSGTSHSAVRQMLFLDPQWARLARERKWRVLLVDDARLTGGTLDSSLDLARRIGLHVVAAATVLNEAEPVDSLGGIPYVWLTKLPLFTGELGSLRPAAGTYDGLGHFYLPL